MNVYKQVSIIVDEPEKLELLVALLSAIGYEGFEEVGEGLSAFIPAEQFDAGALEMLLSGQSISYSVQDIAPQNWNAVWESAFDPVLVEGFAAIRAGFHAPCTNVQHEIIITPKMSFGTGHHATTFMMLQQMSHLEFAGKTVLDFGTGTGVLAILAEKMGAESILAIDNDDWSITNAKENILANGCERIIVQKWQAIPANQRYDIILANINLNIITANLPALAAACVPGANVLLSGFLPQDEASLSPVLRQYGFQNIVVAEKGNWLCIAANAPVRFNNL